MKIAILSRGPDLYSTKRIRDAGKARGHVVKVLDTMAFSIVIKDNEPLLYYKGRKLEEYDAVIPRIGASITMFGTAVVRQFEQMGVYCQNSSGAIMQSRDKLRSIQVLSKHRIGMPSTAFVRYGEYVVPAIHLIGGAPCIIKLLEGTQGIGVILAENVKTAEAIVETLHSKGQNVLIQGFVSESKGKDVRAFVVGGQVVAAMERTAKGEEFRSNVHRGGSTRPITLDPEFEKVAVQSAQIMGLQVAGVDMLMGKDGPKVMEVNSSPGLEGIEKATGVNIADAIIRQLEDQADFPELDIRQRLTLEKGYGIAELVVDAASTLVGKPIAESGLRELDIIVLSMTRGPVNIPNPRVTREILPGDRLVVFGKLENVRGMITRRRDADSQGAGRSPTSKIPLTAHAPVTSLQEAVAARRSGSWPAVKADG